MSTSGRPLGPLRRGRRPRRAPRLRAGGLAGDVDVAELYDRSRSNHPSLEAMGFCKTGEAATSYRTPHQRGWRAPSRRTRAARLQPRRPRTAPPERSPPCSSCAASCRRADRAGREVAITSNGAPARCSVTCCCSARRRHEPEAGTPARRPTCRTPWTAAKRACCASSAADCGHFVFPAADLHALPGDALAWVRARARTVYSYTVVHRRRGRRSSAVRRGESSSSTRLAHADQPVDVALRTSSGMRRGNVPPDCPRRSPCPTSPRRSGARPRSARRPGSRCDQRLTRHAPCPPERDAAILARIAGWCAERHWLRARDVPGGRRTFLRAARCTGLHRESKQRRDDMRALVTITSWRRPAVGCDAARRLQASRTHPAPRRADGARRQPASLDATTSSASPRLEGPHDARRRAEAADYVGAVAASARSRCSPRPTPLRRAAAGTLDSLLCRRTPTTAQILKYQSHVLHGASFRDGQSLGMANGAKTTIARQGTRSRSRRHVVARSRPPRHGQ